MPQPAGAVAGPFHRLSESWAENVMGEEAFEVAIRLL